MMSGKLNPVSSIFLLKNIAGYSDCQTLEFKKADSFNDVQMSIDDIASRLPLEDIERLQNKQGEWGLIKIWKYWHR